jgi:hypothetical protein
MVPAVARLSTTVGIVLVVSGVRVPRVKYVGPTLSTMNTVRLAMTEGKARNEPKDAIDILKSLRNSGHSETLLADDKTERERDLV